MALSTVICVVFLCLSGIPDALALQEGIITKDGINLRSRPNINGAQVGTINKGERVQILGKSYEWYKIVPPPNVYFYVSDRYIYTAPDGSGVCSADNVNVRVAPSLSADIVGRLKNGDKVVVVKNLEGWVQIEPPEGSSVYIHEKFVRIMESANAQEKNTVLSSQLVRQKKKDYAETDTKTIAGQSQDDITAVEATIEKNVDRFSNKAIGLLSKAGGLLGGRYRYKLLDQYGKETLYYLEPFNANVDLRGSVDQIIEISGVISEDVYKDKRVFIVKSIVNLGAKDVTDQDN